MKRDLNPTFQTAINHLADEVVDLREKLAEIQKIVENPAIDPADKLASIACIAATANQQ